MRTALLALATFGFSVVGCGSSSTMAPTPERPESPAASKRVVHRVSVGGSDSILFPPGTDANFSLIAIEHADGSVSGQWTDRFDHVNGFQAEVTCLHVSGNEAWVSGVIKSGTSSGTDLSGLPVITRVRDNGTSANDPADEISFSFVGDGTSCSSAPDLPLFPTNNGQVRVQ